MLIILYYIFLIREGNLSFWKKAAKNPDFVYQKLLKDSAWICDDGRLNISINKDNFVGPFLLYVPSINRTVKFYGKVNKYETSQKKIIKNL